MTALSKAIQFDVPGASKGVVRLKQEELEGTNGNRSMNEAHLYSNISRSGYRRKHPVDAAIERRLSRATPRERRLSAPLWSACLEGMEHMEG